MKNFTWGAIAIALLPISCPAQPGIFPKLDALAAQYVRKPKSRGLSVGILYNGTMHYSGYGQLSDKSAAPPDEETIFELGAISGILTTSILAIHESRGLLEPVTSIGKVMPPGYQIPVFTPTRLEETSQDTLSGKPVAGKTIVCVPDPLGGIQEATLCQLAFHASGLVMPGPPLLDWHPLATFSPPRRTPDDLPGAAELFTLAGKATFRFPPGQQFEFSAMNIALLGHLLAANVDESYDLMLKKVLTDPLEMSDTRTNLTTKQTSRFAPGYDIKGRPAPTWDFSAMAPAMGIKSTVRDMLLLLRALSQSSPPFTPQSTQRLLQGVVPVHFPGWERPTSAALGWLVSTDENNRSIAWMNGATAGHQAFIGIDLQQKRGVVLLSNSSGDLTELGFAMLREL